MSFVLELEYNPNVQLYKRVADAFKKAILDGRLAPGAPLPSVRELSDSLKISRATVLKSFDELYSQGLTESVPSSGTFVSKNLPPDLHHWQWQTKTNEADSRKTEELVPIAISAYAQRIMSPQFAPGLLDDELPGGKTPLEPIQLARWRKLLIRYCKQNHHQKISDPCGYSQLREALQGYLQRTRAVRCSSDRVVVFGTKQGRLDMIARLLINAGDSVAIENPGYPGARQVFESYGAKVVPITVDESGFKVSELVRMNNQVKLVYVTPSHQDPTGAILTLDRRRMLIDWAAKNNAFIVEDDYDCEFRYGSKPIPSLQGIDTADRVIYMSSLWKIFNPICRVGYMVVPECLKNLVSLAKLQTERSLPIAEQIALADLLSSGHLESSLRRCQISYSVDRQRLILALTRHLKDYVQLNGESAGTHIIVRFTTDHDDDEILRWARTCDLDIKSTSPYYIGDAVAGEFMIQFVVNDSELFEEKVSYFANLLRSTSANRLLIGERQC